MTQPRIYRQGDVLVREVVSIPENTTTVAREAGRVILAHGEMTGHAHAIDAPATEAILVAHGERERFLRLMTAAVLTHEEHAAMHLPAGAYEVILQREWTDSDADENERERYFYD